MRRLWTAAWPWLGVAACAVALAFIPRDAWWWGLAAGALLGAANVIGWHEGRREVRALRDAHAIARDDAIDTLLDSNERLYAELDAEQSARRALETTARTLRAETAALRRQNLALDAQLDHMTRVNQALDAGITTTTTQERA